MKEENKAEFYYFLQDVYNTNKYEKPDTFEGWIESMPFEFLCDYADLFAGFYKNS